MNVQQVVIIVPYRDDPEHSRSTQLAKFLVHYSVQHFLYVVEQAEYPLKFRYTSTSFSLMTVLSSIFCMWLNKLNILWNLIKGSFLTVVSILRAKNWPKRVLMFPPPKQHCLCFTTLICFLPKSYLLIMWDQWRKEECGWLKQHGSGTTGTLPCVQVHIFNWPLGFYYWVDSEGCFGGVVMFSCDGYNITNGFPNDFWGWGGEDNAQYHRCVSCFSCSLL